MPIVFRLFVFLLIINASLLEGLSQSLSPATLKSSKQRPARPEPSPSTLAAVGQQVGEGDVLRINANLVTVPAIVMDRNGRYVANLHKDDFEIFEDGTRQTVAFLQRVDQPFTVFVLIDISPSMLPFKEDLTRAVDAFVRELRPHDRVTSFTFFQWLSKLTSLTSVSELRNPLKFNLRNDSAGDCPGTYLYDAVDDVLKRAKKVTGRKAIVLFTDGVGTEYLHTLKENLRNAEEQDALIYTIQFGIHDTETPRYSTGERYRKWIENVDGYMFQLAQKSGGRAYKMENIADSVERTCEMIGDELRAQYTLGYYPLVPLAAGQRRTIKVKVNRNDLVVRARDSYVTGKDRSGNGRAASLR